jgi:hypothetical protein
MVVGIATAALVAVAACLLRVACVCYCIRLLATFVCLLSTISPILHILIGFLLSFH